MNGRVALCILINRSLTREKHEMYHDIIQDADDLPVHSLPGDYSRKDLILRLGIMSTESVRNPFPSTFDVRCLRGSSFVSIEHQNHLDI